MIPRQYLLLLLLTGLLRWAASYLTRSLVSYANSTNTFEAHQSRTEPPVFARIQECASPAQGLHRRTNRTGIVELALALLIGLVHLATRSLSPVVSLVAGYTGEAVMIVGIVGAFVVYGRSIRLRRMLYRLEDGSP